MKQNIIIAIVVAAVFVIGFIMLSSRPLGGLIHNTIETFVSGVTIGSNEKPACIKVMDTDKGGWSYATYLNGVETVTGGAAGAFAIPTACQ